MEQWKMNWPLLRARIIQPSIVQHMFVQLPNKGVPSASCDITTSLLERQAPAGRIISCCNKTYFAAPMENMINY